MEYENLIQAHYFHEVDRRRDLDAALSIPLGVITAVFAALGVMIDAITLPFSNLEIGMAALAGLASVAALTSTYYIMRSLVGFMYRHPTSMKALADWRTEVIDKGSSEEKADAEVRRLMTEQYAIAAEQNCINNDRKAAFRYRASLFAAISLLLVVLSSIPYFVAKIEAKADLKGAPHPGTVTAAGNEN